MGSDFLDFYLSKMGERCHGCGCHTVNKHCFYEWITHFSTRFFGTRHIVYGFRLVGGGLREIKEDLDMGNGG